MPFDVFQQVFALSHASNAVNNDKGNQKILQEQLQSQVTSDLPLIGAEWQLVWGPVVWKHDPDITFTGPDNAWYIAYHPCLHYEDGSVYPTYVIAVAGTPPQSLYVWALEDFLVSTVTDFKAWVASGIQNYPIPLPGILPGAYLASGTVTTTHLLLTTAAPDGAKSAGMTLLNFIKNVDQSASPRFITTGHSLGGALSPSLALALVKAGFIPADNTLTYPTAGPSPGNDQLTELFVQTFPPRKLPGAASYQGWNLNLVNTLDSVPQAWAIDKALSPKQNLFHIPGIYGEPILAEVQLTIWLAALWSGSSGVAYKPIPSQYFTSAPPPSVPKSLFEFTKVVHSEHVTAYNAEVGAYLPRPKESAVRRPGLTAKTENEKGYNFPVINDLEWALDHPEEAHQVQDKVQAIIQAPGFVLGKVGGLAGGGLTSSGLVGGGLKSSGLLGGGLTKLGL